MTKHFGNKLQSFTKAVGLSRIELSKIGGVSERQIANYYNGQEPKLTFFTALKESYPQLNMNWMLGNEEEMFLDKEQGDLATDYSVKKHAELNTDNIKDIIRRIGRIELIVEDQGTDIRSLQQGSKAVG